MGVPALTDMLNVALIRRWRQTDKLHEAALPGQNATIRDAESVSCRCTRLS